MAENLSVPADFAESKQKGVNMNLLPPSAFQTKTRQGDPWKEIAKATEEVVKLKIENTKLKEAQSKSPEPTIAQPVPAPVIQEPAQRAPPPEICKYSSKKEDFKYIDELINKQACEITELKNELRSLKCQHREEMTEMERQLTLKEREYTHQVTSLEVELKAAEDRYESQMDRLSREHHREADNLRGTIDKLQEELENIKTRSSERISDLETTYENFKRNSDEQVEKLMQELKSKEVTMEKQVKQIGQLKKYIGETENLPKPKDIARKEMESMVAKLKTYESERENMNSTIQLLNIRLNSMNEILKLQELELSKGKPYFVDIPSLDQTVDCKIYSTCVIALYVKSTIEVVDVHVTVSFLDNFEFGPVRSVTHKGETMYQADLSFEHFMHGKEKICFVAIDKNGISLALNRYIYILMEEIERLLLTTLTTVMPMHAMDMGSVKIRLMGLTVNVSHVTMEQNARLINAQPNQLET
ncbi:ribosome-binding protein 1-like [Mercenaria mercenaria]|uniref:ribosome-binding protein 1-like n=1 Tax=Mercenaria mercenaria TaxID=6596 RepID=UPI00234EADAA|nr:ribosome-binding protein 1-like [Mercenaria mercenaria]